jgi:DNA-binding NarL/FixJ family response regulator
MIQVLIVEDDKDWLKGLSAYLDQEEDICVVGQSMDSETALELERKLNVDVVLMDIVLANSLAGIQAAETIHHRGQARVIMLTSMEEKHIIFDAFKAGAIDYIMKTDFEDIPDAVRAAYRDQSPINPSVASKMRAEFSRLKQLEEQYEAERIKSRLTPTELHILRLIAKGYTQTEIADQLVVSIRTIKAHVGNILKKVPQKNSREAAKKAKELGII